MNELHVGTVEPLAEHVHVYKHLYLALLKVLNETFPFVGGRPAVNGDGVYPVFLVIRGYVTCVADAYGVNDAFLSVGILPHAFIQSFDCRPAVEHGVHLLYLIVAVCSALLQSVYQPLVIAVRTNRDIIKGGEPAFPDEVGYTVRCYQSVKQIGESPAVHAAGRGRHAEFLRFGVAPPKFPVSVGKRVMGLVYHDKPRSVTDVVKVSCQPLNRTDLDSPSGQKLPHRRVYLPYKLAPVGDNPHAAVLRRASGLQFLAHNSGKHAGLARSRGHLHKHAAAACPRLNDTADCRLLVIAEMKSCAFHGK